MDASSINYDFSKSLERIDKILATPQGNFTESKGVPAKSSLTYENGFYVDITVVCVDIRGSKSLASKHTKPVLAKIYRAYISEVIAIMQDNDCINDVYVEGDGVWAVFNTITPDDVNGVFYTAFTIASLIDALNIKFSKKGYQTINVGIGIDDSESLYIKAGHNGSGVNEVVWIGKTIGKAAELSSFGNRTDNDKEIMISENVHCNLSEHNKNLMSWNADRGCYHGNVINTALQQWVEKNG